MDILTVVYVSDAQTGAPIAGATVTCTGQTPHITQEDGFTGFYLNWGTTYTLRANADGYVISDAKVIVGSPTPLSFELEKEEQIQITVKRPTWVSMELTPVAEEYPISEELLVWGYLRIETEPYTEGEVWLIDVDAGEVITDIYQMGSGQTGDVGFYMLNWAPSTYKPEGYNITVGCDAFVSAGNPLGAWSEEPNGFTKHINVVESVANMRIITFGPHGELLLNDTITISNDYTEACTMFKFQIWNASAITAGAWYKVSFVGGGTLYEGETSELGRGIGAFSDEITDYICALPGAGSLPIGAHEVKVEVGPIGCPTPTHIKTETINVISATTLSVTTYDAGDTTVNGARLKGSVVNTNGLQTDIGFEYGETASYGSTVWTDMTTTPCDFYDDITDLDSHTRYHFRAIAENETNSAHGEDVGFWTRKEDGGQYFSILLPNETLLDSNEVMACDDHTLACTKFNFQIKDETGATRSAWYTVSTSDGGAIYTGTVSVPIYISTETISDYICALPGDLPVGEHEIIIEVGLEGREVDVSVSEVLTVLEYSTPVVYTIGVDDPTLNSARLVGALKDVGIETQVGFEYGLQYGTTTIEWLDSYIRGGEFKLNISSLEANSIYRFRALGRIEDKAGYGVEALFETTPAIIAPISLGWGLEDAKVSEYNAHLGISNLSEAKRYKIILYGGREYEFARVEPVTGRKEVEIKANIPMADLEEYGYELHCGVYDLDVMEWLLTEGYLVSPLNVTVNMTETIAAGGIPPVMETRTDTPFTFTVDNKSTADLGVDIFLSFRGVSITQEYPRDIEGLVPAGGGFTLPGSDILVWDDGFVANNPILIRAGESGSYTLKAWLPDEAVPIGQTGAEYTIHTKVGVYTA